jgi:hypothetical protein
VKKYPSGNTAPSSYARPFKTSRGCRLVRQAPDTIL